MFLQIRWTESIQALTRVGRGGEKDQVLRGEVKDSLRKKLHVLRSVGGDSTRNRLFEHYP